MILVCSLVFIEVLHITYHKTAPPCPAPTLTDDDW